MAKNNLKRVMDNEELKQVDLSTSSGVGVGTISKIYNKKSTPSPATKERLVKGLNKIAKNEYSIEDIFE